MLKDVTLGLKLAQWVSVCCTRVKTWVQIPITHEKSHRVVYVCNPKASSIEWEAEIGDPLDQLACGGDPALNKM